MVYWQYNIAHSNIAEKFNHERKWTLMDTPEGQPMVLLIIDIFWMILAKMKMEVNEEDLSTTSTFDAWVVRVKVLNFSGFKWHQTTSRLPKMLNFEKPKNLQLLFRSVSHNDNLSKLVLLRLVLSKLTIFQNLYTFLVVFFRKDPYRIDNFLDSVGLKINIELNGWPKFLFLLVSFSVNLGTKVVVFKDLIWSRFLYFVFKTHINIWQK